MPVSTECAAALLSFRYPSLYTTIVIVLSPKKTGNLTQSYFLNTTFFLLLPFFWHVQITSDRGRSGPRDCPDKETVKGYSLEVSI